jgi:16S rRNA (cytidine1402-2'-O)-methyltransferase
VAEGRLFVCATPIGNLGDVSRRLAETLKTVDVVYAEDTRRTGKLLGEVGSDAPLRSLFQGNEMKRTGELIADLSSGRSVALVSDAGMPGVSDPGAAVVSAAHDRGIPVTVVPGPSAVTSALAVSGWSGDRFVFEGFLERKGKARSAQLDRLAGSTSPVVVFLSPHRISDDLADLRDHLGGGRLVVVARELTKLHEEIWRGPLDDASRRWPAPAKGEFTVVIEGVEQEQASDDEAIEVARGLVAAGSSNSDAARAASAQTGVSRRVIYQGLLERQG